MVVRVAPGRDPDLMPGRFSRAAGEETRTLRIVVLLAPHAVAASIAPQVDSRSGRVSGRGRVERIDRDEGGQGSPAASARDQRRVEDDQGRAPPAADSDCWPPIPDSRSAGPSQ